MTTRLYDTKAQALRDFAAVLPQGGRLVLLVPALPALYGTLDVALHHFRRYDKDALAKLQAGADVVQIYTGLIYKGPKLVDDIARAFKRQRTL